LISPDPGDRGEPDVRIGRTGGSAVGQAPALIRSGVQELARGALICPGCELPLAPGGRLHPREALACGFCGHEAEALSFMRRDVRDAPANEVVLVARVG
jgi:hypothetical protein